MPAKATKTKKSARARPRAQEEHTARPKYPRHSVERALRIPRAILEQNAGKPCTPEEAAGYLGVGAKGPFAVEISSATKYKFVDRPGGGKIQPTELARRIIRPTSPEDEVKGYREAILNAPEISGVYKHYRGENIPDETFYHTTQVRTGDRQNPQKKLCENLDQDSAAGLRVPRYQTTNSNMGDRRL